MPIYTYPDPLGNINNKKCFSSVTTDGVTVNYILSTKPCSTGKQLVIYTTKGSSGVQQPSTTFIPLLPYRFILADYNNFHNRIKPKLLPYYEFVNLYNPGITATSSSITTPTVFNNVCKFIEINIPRDSFSSLVGYNLFYNNISGVITWYWYNDIKAYDLQASMIVGSIDSTYDYLIITVCSKIFLSTGYGDKTYSIPVTVLLKINRTELTTTNPITKDILPYSWSYPISSKWTSENSSVTIGKINSNDTGNILTSTWNYNFIPGSYKARAGFSDTSLFFPRSFGCIADSDFNDASYKAVVLTSIGNYSPKTNSFLQYHTANILDLTNAGFNLPSKSNEFSVSEMLTSKLSIYKNGEYYILARNCYSSKGTELYITIMDSNLVVKSNTIITNSFQCDLLEKNGVLFLTYSYSSNYTSSGSELYIFKLPTLTTDIFNLINGKVFSGSGFKDLLISSSFGSTLIVSMNSPLSSCVDSTFDIYLPSGTKNTVSLIGTGQDKTLNPNNSSNDYNLKIISNNCLLLESYIMAVGGQITSSRQFKV